MNRNRRFVVTMMVTGLVAAIALLVFVVVRHYHIRHFYVVAPGKLYRSGQPVGADWARLQRNHGIRTVINLRFDDGQDPDLVEEPAILARLGIRYVNIPMRDGGIPTREQAGKFLDVATDPANWPVLVHCKRGRDRAGVMSAIYRMAADRWSPDQAADEMVRLHGGEEMPNYRAFLHDYVCGNALCGHRDCATTPPAVTPKG